MAGTAITCFPAAPVSTKDVCKFTVADAEVNDVSEYNAAIYPTEPERRYYIRLVKSAVEYGRSHVFGVDSGGDGVPFFSYIFPSAGTWTVTLCDSTTNAVVATATVTVS